MTTPLVASFMGYSISHDGHWLSILAFVTAKAFFSYSVLTLVKVCVPKSWDKNLNTRLCEICSSCHNGNR